MDDNDIIIHPTNADPWWKRRKALWIGTIVLAVLTVIISVSVATRPRRGHVWEELKVEKSGTDSQMVKLTGTWNDRIVVVGHEGDNSIVENYKRDGNGYERLGSFPVPGHVSSMAVSDAGSIIALALDQPFEFLVYERKNGEDWILSGSSITLEQLGLTTSKYSHPTVMLSDKGDLLGLGLQGDDAGVYILEKNANGQVGGQWSLKAPPVLNTFPQDHGKFATFAAMSGDGSVVAVASEINKLSLYRYGGLQYDLYASYEESPRIGQGDLALSFDGSVFSVASYEGLKKGMGQLHVVNDQWPWYIDESNHEGKEVDLFRTSIETALSEDGSRVVIGRYPLRTEGQDDQVATLQVYEHDPIDNKWNSRGKPFGKQTSNSRRGSVDISDDGSLVAASMDGKVYVYEYHGQK